MRLRNVLLILILNVFLICNAQNLYDTAKKSGNSFKEIFLKDSSKPIILNPYRISLFYKNN